MAASMKSMFLLRKFQFLRNIPSGCKLCGLKAYRFISTIATDKTLEPDPWLHEVMKKQGVQFKYRKHPGIMNVNRVVLPIKLETAINTLQDVYKVNDIEKLSTKLSRYLWSRHLPAEPTDLKAMARNLEAEEYQGLPANFDRLSPEEQFNKLNEKKNKVLAKLRKHTYHWEALRFDARNSMVYMMARIAYEYSSLFRIFTEISRRVPDFRPETFFDFGSGTGSAMWAAHSIWNKSLKEHYCVDTSPDMNTLAQLLLQGGKEEGSMCFDGVYFRQFLPGSHKNKFNLVISAYSLFELPSASERLKVIRSLWKKTQDFLVIVEAGSNAGFRAITEARDAIKKMSDLEESGELILNATEKYEEISCTGHVFSPCPHDKVCPKKNDRTPCNFEVGFKPLEWAEKNGKLKERYSYVVFRKGRNKNVDAAWPRVIRPTSIPARHVHCRLCCSHGKLEHHILTAKKNGTDLYKCTRASKWGDLIPAIIVPSKKKDKKPYTEPDINSSEECEKDDDREDEPGSAALYRNQLEGTSVESISDVDVRLCGHAPVNYSYTEESLECLDTEDFGVFRPVW